MKETIIQVAMALFARKGFAGTSMREIAGAADVTKAALYYHFPDKESLFHEAMRTTSRYLNRRVDEQTAGIADPAARLGAIVHAKLKLFVEEVHLIRSLYNHLFLPEDHSMPMAEEIREGERLLRDAVAACAKEGYLERRDVETTTTVLAGAIEYGGARWLLDPEAQAPGPRLGDAILALVIPGLKKTPGTRRRPVRQAAAGAGKSIGRLTLFLALLWPAGAPSQGPQPDSAVVAIPGGDEVLTPEDCVQLALGGNARLLSVRDRMGELRAMKLQAVAQVLPTVDLSGGWSRGRDPSFALDETFSGSGGDDLGGLDSLFGGSFLPAPEDIHAQTFWRASITTSWELRPSRVYNAVGAAGHRLRQQDAVVLDAEHRTAEEVVHAYYDVVAAAERMGALEAQRTARREFLEIARRRLLVEFATPLDTLQAAVSLANLDPQVRRARQELRNSGARLNVLMGRPALAPVAVDGDAPADPLKVDPERALTRVEERPDIAQLHLMERVLEKTRATQKAGVHPYLSMEASYGYVGRTLDTVTDTGHDFWSARVSVEVPLFDGLLTKGLVRETDAAVRRARRERQDAVSRARLEVLTLLGDLAAARENLKAAALNLRGAEEALRRMRQRYEVGKAEYLEVLNAESERFTAKSEEITARSEVSTLTASLKRALGLFPLQPLTEAASQ
jgi:outer membrane protein TolC/AcrR family transcriptional regulator